MAESRKTSVDLVQASDHPDVIATFERVGSATGVANIHRVIANSPTVFARYIGFVYALRHDTVLDPADRELALLSVLERHGGEYELPPHRRLARSLGLSEDQLANVLNPEATHLFSERQAAILRFAERFAANPADRKEFEPDGVESHLSSQERVELALTLALYLGMSHFTAVIDVPVGEDPSKFKLPGPRA